MLCWFAPAVSAAEDADAAPAVAPAPVSAPAATLFIQEYRVQGAKTLPADVVEETVYPFMGPDRTQADIESARAALEKAYQLKGYQTVSVQVPEQQVKADGVVVLQVTEGTIGRVRVKNARYFSPERIRQQAPSLVEGTVPNFNDVQRDIVALNQSPERQVTPSLTSGKEPGTVDIELTVEDKVPFDASVELNNRQSPNTKPLRLNGSASYHNLWQRGHTLGFSFQVAPQRPADSQVFSAFYLARVEGTPWLSLMATATQQDSNVATLGGSASVGKGQIVGLRALMTLPSPDDTFFHSASVGFDYKNLEQNLITGGSTTASPVTYVPIITNYSATWIGTESSTKLNLTPTLHLRGVNGDADEFANRRAHADGAFFYVRGDFNHTHELPAGMQVFGKIQGQLTGNPLLDSEQWSAGGLDTVRGYYESEAAGDSGFGGTIELRSPSLLSKGDDEWRFYLFGEHANLFVNHPLPEQTRHFELASVGVGTRVRYRKHFSASLDLGLPLVEQGSTQAGEQRLTFTLGASY